MEITVQVEEGSDSWRRQENKGTVLMCSEHLDRNMPTAPGIQEEDSIWSGEWMYEDVI